MKVVMKCRGDFSHLVRIRHQLTCHPAVPFARLTECHTTGPCQQPLTHLAHSARLKRKGILICRERHCKGHSMAFRLFSMLAAAGSLGALTLVALAQDPAAS